MIWGRRELLSSVSSNAYANYFSQHDTLEPIAAGMAYGFYLDDALPWEPRAASATPMPSSKDARPSRACGRCGWARSSARILVQDVRLSTSGRCGGSTLTSRPPPSPRRDQHIACDPMRAGEIVFT